MKDVIVLIYDMVACQYSAPIIFSNEACAVRYFKNNVKENVEDYQIVKVGSYDSKTGEIEKCDRVILNKGE